MALLSFEYAVVSNDALSDGGPEVP